MIIPQGRINIQLFIGAFFFRNVTGGGQTGPRLKRATRRKFSAEKKIRIVLAGLRGEDSIAELWAEMACTKI